MNEGDGRVNGPLRAVLAAMAVAAIAAACSGTPSANVSSSGSTGSVPTRQEAYEKSGKVTLLVVDEENSASGMKEYTALNKAFEARYPNITIHRVIRNFTELMPQEPLLLAGSNVPDAIETDESYATQGRLAKAGLLTNLDGYAKSWGWSGRQSESLLLCCRVGRDGRGLGSGPQWGVPTSSQVVGVYYNVELLHRLGLSPPKTRADFEAALAKAKAAGITPIVTGNAESSDTITWGYQLALDMNATPEQQQAVLLGRKGATYKTPWALAAAEELASWGAKGYYTPGYLGQSSDQAGAAFQKGDGLFFIDGSWWAGGFADAMNGNVGYLTPPAPSAGETSSGIYAAGQPWAIPSRAKHPLAAALYLDFISDPANRHHFVTAGDFPAGPADISGLQLQPVIRDIYASQKQLGSRNAALPFFWATPQAQTYWQHEGSGVLDGHIAPQDFVNGLDAALQKDVEQYG